MHPPRLPSRMYHKLSILIVIFTFFLTGIAISLGGCKKSTPSPTATSNLPSAIPTTAPQPIPPTLVETNPPPGSQLALKNPITFYFNQPMQRSSVEAAMTGDPDLSGSFAWLDDSTMIFTPDSALLPDASQTITISTAAQSAQGMALQRPISLSYTTVASLRLVQSLPADGTEEVAPTSAVVAAFNQPVVALGADPGNLPAGFTISPPANGKGEWINTSTYIFYPEPALAGGISYQVQPNQDLVSTGGSPLKSGTAWSFSTIMPRLASTSPADGDNHVRLDTNVQLNFSYSMDATSLEENFYLQASDGDLINGRSAWNDDFTTFTYTPTQLLDHATTYSIVLGDGVAALGGTRLDHQAPISWTTYPNLSVLSTVPSEGGIVQYDGIDFILSTLVDYELLDHYITITPGNPLIDGRGFEDQTVSLYWYFEPDTDYTLTVSPDLTDLWGSRLGQAYTLHFRTAPLRAGVEFPYESEFVFLTTQDKGMMAQVTNEYDIPITVGTITIDDLIPMLDLYNGDDFQHNFVPTDAESWTFHPNIPRNQSTVVTLLIAPDGRPRSPGLYFICHNETIGDCYYPTILAVSHYQVILKLTPTEAFVWAVDLNTNTPGVDLPVTVYDRSGHTLAAGTTDVSGVFRSTSVEYPEEYRKSFAVLGQPGEDTFGFAISDWNEGVDIWNFGIWTDYSPQTDFAYIYTDRPIYRPGDTVYFRLIARQAFNGRYSLPEISNYPLVLENRDGEQLASFELPLSSFGAAHGEYTLPVDAQPGTYVLMNPNDRHYSYPELDRIYFEVAEYRKPEIDLQVAFKSTEVLSETILGAEINARYFFDAPAGNLPIHWVLYGQRASFHSPNYQVGPVDTSWLLFDKGPPYIENALGLLGYSIAKGDARLDANGLARISIPTRARADRQKYTLEVSLTDESGLPVYGRASTYVYPGKYYIGIHPDSWSYAAEAEAGFNILVADMLGNPAGSKTLNAKFQRVEWERHDPPPDKPQYWYPNYEAHYTLIMSTTFSTNADGTARLTFTPPEPGSYQLDVSGEDTLTQV
ncbi:MAG TPA: Ig-like domain-containing protein, partial [Anaerolineales bacterium]|nr:Ig-like domain-containing protein [Anaerolineales bacterium]